MTKYVKMRTAKRIQNPVFNTSAAQAAYDSTGDYRVWTYNDPDELGYDVYCIAETNTGAIVADNLYADDVEEWFIDFGTEKEE